MSMFSNELMPNGKMLDDMMKETRALMPAELAGTVNLMAHPLAGVAAMSALGLGFASHAAGVWFGALSGATAASQRMFASAFDEYVSTDEFRDTTRTPEKRAKAAALALIAEVSAAPAARDVEPPKPAAEKPQKILRVVDTPPTVEAVPVAAPKPAKAGQRKPARVVAPAQEAQPVAEVETQATKVEPPVDEAVPLTAEAVELIEAAPAETVAVESVAEPLIAEVALPVVEAAPAAPEVAPVTADILPASPLKPASIEKPELPDDLKAISGIGPKLEQVLNGFGVWTYAQIAGWGAPEVAWMDDTLGFKGRIDRDGWIAQAAVLAGAKH